MQPDSTNQKPGKKVLCVEDEHFINELYARALTKAGYQVKVVIDGGEGLKEILTDSYDIVLLDIMIPNMIGTEVLKKLRAQAPNLKARIIITTNLELSDEDRAAIEAQADGYVVKADLTPKQMAEFLKQLDA
ncbi:MAG: response regulator transcription factor [Acidobacteriota bacterium]